MKKYLLYGHGGAYNHGAEAILRSTIPLIREHNPSAPVFLSTHFPEQDRKFGLDKLVDRLIPADLSLVADERTQPDFESKAAVARRIYRDALAEIDKNTICLAVGGDNYCYPNWYRQSVFHETAKKRGAKSILWGCSIQPEDIDSRMEMVLRGHDHIFARESLTRDALLAHGITQVTLGRDPAFRLIPQAVPLPNGFVPGRTAAFNVSPLVLRKGKNLLPYFVDAARTLLQYADAVLMLPHVTMPVDNDLDALRNVAAHLTEDERRRLCWAPTDLNAAQLKYLISQCEVLVCCRTHASIAGYSTGVPTLVAGYSVKAQGIALDLGMKEWVLTGRELSMLPVYIETLLRNEVLIRKKHISKEIASKTIF